MGNTIGQQRIGQHCPPDLSSGPDFHLPAPDPVTLPTIVIPATPFLRQTMGGLSGIARHVIVAELAGARRIVIAAESPIEPDWEKSFALRERALPEIEVVADPGSAAAGPKLLLPGDRLLNAAGMQRLLAGVPIEELQEGTESFSAGEPREVTWRLLLATLKAGEGWVGRNLNRPISFRMAALAMRIGITPNQITWLTFLIALVMAGLLGLGGAAGLAIGGALYQVVSVVDCVDGDIARVSYLSSRRGAALDTALDMIANLGFMGGLGVGLVRTYGSEQLLAAGLLVGVAATAMAFMTILLRIGPKRGSFDVLRAALEVRLAATPRLRAVVMTAEKMFKRDFYALFFATLCLLGLAKLLLWLALGGAIIWVLAIAWCAPLIAGDQQGTLLPGHLRGS